MITQDAELEPPKLSAMQHVQRSLKSLRWWAVVPVPLIILSLNAWGPDSWREPLLWVVWTSKALILLAVAHASRRLLFPTLDLSRLIEQSEGGNIASAVVAAAAKVFMAMVFLGLVNYAKAQSPATYIPANAVQLMPMLKKTTADYWPGFVFPSYFGALIEQESCVRLTNPRCWNSAAQLKTSREEGAGLGQFTRAYRADGSLRFDALNEARQIHPVELAEFNWQTVYTRADLSMRAIVLTIHDTARKLSQLAVDAAPYDILAFSDASYNGGLEAVLTDRKLCYATSGCDPNKWFGNVELHSMKSKAALPGYGANRSPFAISREHVTNVLRLRRPKYMAGLGPDLA